MSLLATGMLSTQRTLKNFSGKSPEKTIKSEKFDKHKDKSNMILIDWKYWVQKNT